MSDITNYTPADILAVNLEMLKAFFQVALKSGGMSQAAMDAVFGIAAQGIQRLDPKKFSGALQLLEETRTDVQLFAPEPQDHSS